jgi:hypothetical protein
MDGGSTGAAGSGSSKNLEGLPISQRQARDWQNDDIHNSKLQFLSQQAPLFRQHAKIIHRKKHYADTEKDFGKRPETVVEKELPYHPNRIAAYPAADGQIVKQVGGVLPSQPSNVKSRRNCRHNHEQAFQPPFH